MAVVTVYADTPAAEASAATPAASESVIEIAAMDYVKCGDNINPEFQGGMTGETTAISLKPVDASKPLECYYQYTVNIPRDCESVEMDFTYADSGDRHMRVSFADTTGNVDCPIPAAGELSII